MASTWSLVYIRCHDCSAQVPVSVLRPDGFGASGTCPECATVISLPRPRKEQTVS